MKKICPGCGEERDAEQDFNWKYKERGIRNARCKFCQSQVSKQHYKNNKQTYLDRARTREVRVTIETEIAKCEVRCANCHRIKTLERGKWWRFGLVE